MLIFTWYPPSGALPLTFGDSAPYLVTDATGLSANEATPKTRAGVGQWGESLIGIVVGPRVIAMEIAIIGADDAARWQLRQSLATAFVPATITAGATPTSGTLRINRGFGPLVEISAVPRAAPEIVFHPGYAVATVEFFCPDPSFRETADASVLLAGSGGFVFPLTHPFSLPANSPQVEIANNGTIDAPPLIRVYGDITAPRLTNITTGAQLELTGNIPAGSYIEIETDYGKKAVTLVDSLGARANAMNRLNLALAGTILDTFWKLRPGVNTVQLSAVTNVSGIARLFYRQRYAGI